MHKEFLERRRKQEIEHFDRNSLKENKIFSALVVIEINLTELCNRKCVFCPRVDPKIFPNRNLHTDLKTTEKIAIDLKLIDESLFIDCNEDIQFKRVSYRDKLDESLIKSIINSQLSRDQKIKKADKIIKNNHSKALLKDEIYQFHNELQLRIDRK